MQQIERKQLDFTMLKYVIVILALKLSPQQPRNHTLR